MNDITRFNTKWERASSGCHEWRAGFRDTKGRRHKYGAFWAEGRMWRAHVWLFWYHWGWTPETVRHTCDNPKCVNRAHLIPGTNADNVQDRVVKGRTRNQHTGLAPIN